MGAFRIAHGSSIDDVDDRIVKAKYVKLHFYFIFYQFINYINFLKSYIN